MDGKDRARSFPAVDPVDQLFQTAVAGRVHFILSVHPVVERNIGMGQGLFFDQISDVTRLGLRLAKELSADRNAAEKVPDDDGGSVGCADLLQTDIDGRIGGIGSKVIIEGPGAGNGSPDFGDHFHLGHGSDAGQGLTPEPQGGQAGQVVGVPYFTGRMAHKGPGDLILLYAAAVIRDPDHTDAAVFDFDSDGSGSGVYRIFDQFLHDVERALYDLSRRDPAYGLFVEKFDFHSCDYDLRL